MSQAEISRRRVIATLILAAAPILACQDPSTRPAGAGLSSLTAVDTIGTLSGAEAETFGDIEDVEATADGSILVLDRQAPGVVLFSSEAELLASRLSEGEGPGEFRRPNDMVVVGDTAFVLDPSNSRINLFTVADLDLQPAGQIGLSIPGWALCEVSGRIYLHYLRDDNLLHEIDRDGEVVRSFAPAIEPPESFEGSMQRMVQDQRLLGPILCSEDPGVILAIGGLSPRLRAFDLEGGLLWEVDVPDYRASTFRMERGRPTWTLEPETGAHATRSLVRWDPESVLLQLAIRYPVDPSSGARRDSRLESRLISLEDGGELARSEGVPFLATASGDRFFGWETEPFPHVLIYRAP